MLKGIHPAISPDLFKTLAEMGHGDEIVLADAHFPGHSMNARVLQADGLAVTTLLAAILPLFELDAYAPPLIMMAAVPGDQLDPAVEKKYLAAIRAVCPEAPAPERVERFAFYDRAKNAYAVVMTGETAKYGNIILKKGVTADRKAEPERSGDGPKANLKPESQRPEYFPTS
jgi:L-fucose mutarotase